ncbi:MAG: AraC family transcriptional regulator [Hespellia sp.]|nr:AraC family transcriptional regulator [Hespellia sp.]
MEYLLRRISILNTVGIFCIGKEEDAVQSFQEHSEYNPIAQSEALRQRLIGGAKRQKEPYICKDDLSVYFACIQQEEHFYMIGPMSLKLLDRVEHYQYYRSYGMADFSEKRLVHFTFSEMLDIVELVTNILLKEEYTDNDLIYANQLVQETKEQEEQEQVLYDMKEGEEELYHHTYQEERKLLDSIREGRIEETLRYSRNMDADLGKLSSKELNHWKNVAIVAITLCTRAAIDGGISPSIAYRISDFYIQKSDGCNDIAQVIKYRDHAVEELTQQVQKKKGRKTSSYVERCRDYVEKHYRNKIYLADIADTLGLSETYLSRLFKKETGVRLQDYIVGIRLEHAANLLKYSEETISNIAEYVNFPSQSYMGKVFKEKYQMSPKKYREQNSPTEYFTVKQ